MSNVARIALMGLMIGAGLGGLYAIMWASCVLFCIVTVCQRRDREYRAWLASVQRRREIEEQAEANAEAIARVARRAR